MQSRGTDGHRILGVDPGDVHTGWAIIERSGGITTGEWAYVQVAGGVRGQLERGLDCIAAEQFVLYPGKETEQRWSDFKTVRLLGMIEYLAQLWGVPLYLQGAYIKKPTRRQLAARGIKQVGSGPHERDAELHARYRQLRRTHDNDAS